MKSHGILAVYPDSILQIHTTRSPSFLGLDRPTSPLTNLSHDGSDTIIGFLDTGIWPERRSFADRNMGPIPTRWRGECEEGEGFIGSSCNRKLIGARFFSGGYDASPVGPINDTAEFRSPRDSNGHGTHVASVAAGSRVGGAGFRGFARGVARGMAPKARIAIYKVCWKSGCLLSDMCKALEKAVSDGVDIVSVSLGSSSAPFYLDPFAVASFRAFQSGVLVAVSAGNEGPDPGTIVNSPPWILTVGAGTIDRDFPASVVLGDGQRVNGVSLAPETELTRLTRKPHSLFSAGKISSPSNAFSPESVRGRVVLCIVDRHVSRVALGASLKYAGAAAMILSHGDLDPKGILAEPHVIPAVAINVEEADRIDEYIKRGNQPTALILSEGKDRLDVGPAPMVASFSSRGPNRAMPAILKPDLLAPGINILGSWTDAIAPSNFVPDIRRSEFNIMSGTSMACPHVSGVAALIKSAHPEWGPSEIKSALMTTASSRTRTYPGTLIRDELTNHAASPFDIGSGHLRPDLALDPGLVYDVDHEDYVRHLCRLNYTLKEIRIVAGIRVSCRVGDEKWELNYPAFVATLEEVEETKEVVFVRRLKMVGEVRNGVGVYSGKVVGLNGYDVWVEPKRLRFRVGFGERLGFKLGVRKGKKEGCLDKGRKGLAVGALVWREEGGKHVVRSPIVVFSKVEMFRV
ncbi:subtilisin-like protein protease [Cinnamomum micranthum f. kanehirae]|uniref:Subtilisin-like protein protease n=1 Tax=Cinnamomum micranthum f. kanehirae TaxID=337451 RepID=A0A443PKT4_9MAGN|nr:subtilisin-like protein protease [Cinnamomum micranthum f. kanehirae]